MAEERDPAKRAARKATGIGAPTLPRPMEAGVPKPTAALARVTDRMLAAIREGSVPQAREWGRITARRGRELLQRHRSMKALQGGKR